MSSLCNCGGCGAFYDMGSVMRQFLLGLWIAGVILFLIGSCANEQAERRLWKGCGISHEECYHVEDFRACEYEFYKECIDG